MAAKQILDVSKMTTADLETLLAERKAQELAELRKNLEPRKKAWLAKNEELQSELEELQRIEPNFQAGAVSRQASIKRVVKANPGLSYDAIAVKAGLEEADVKTLIENNLKKSNPIYAKDDEGGISMKA